jgi:hypothetical protein
LGILGGNNFAGGDPSVVPAKAANDPLVAVLVSVLVHFDPHLGAVDVDALPAGLEDHGTVSS